MTFFSAAQGQGAPGGSSAPGNVLLLSAGLAGGALLSLRLSEPGAVTLLVGALLACTQVLTAWSDCRFHRVGAGKALGQPCPRCGKVQRVQVWSR